MLDRIGYDPVRMAAAASAADTVIGRVLRVDRGLVNVLTEQGVIRSSYGGALLATIARDPEATPGTGDWVVVREWPDRRTTVESVLPRSSRVVRGTAGEQSWGQVLCANADYVAVVAALHPLPSIARIERLLALAWDSGAQPLVLLTKSDLVSDAAQVAEDVAAAAPGVEVICCSTTTGEGIDGLRERLADGLTLALIGSSGHGKSSLTNALVGTEVLTTRSIREDGRGRHTSVRRELVVLPTGGAVIDTPGLRGIALLDNHEGLGRAFADIERLVASCRFADCSHVVEPGCAVRQALETGALHQRRYDSWVKLQREIAWMDRRREQRQAGRQAGRPRETRKNHRHAE